MDLFGGIVVYVIVWWLVLFTVLPWGVRPPAQPEKGHATSAPARPRLLLKFLITTVIATGFWFVVEYVITSGILRLSDG